MVCPMPASDHLGFTFFGLFSGNADGLPAVFCLVVLVLGCTALSLYRPKKD